MKRFTTRIKKKITGMDKRTRNILLVLLAIVIIIGIAIGIMRFYLNIQLILGYDVLIDLRANDDYISIKNQEDASFEFTTSVRTNPFCSAECTYSLRDMDTGKLVDSSDSNITLIDPLENQYNMTTEKGTGAKIYRYEIGCVSHRSFFCRTSGDKTSRRLSVTLEHELNDEQEEKRDESMAFVKNFSRDIPSAYSNILSVNRTLPKMKKYSEIKSNFSDIISRLNDSENIFKDMKSLWEDEEYIRLSKFISENEEEIYRPILEADQEFRKFNYSVSQFNQALDNVVTARGLIYELENLMVWNYSIYREINMSEESLNDTIDDIERRNEMKYKLNNSNSTLEELKKVHNKTIEHHEANIDWLENNYYNLTQRLCKNINCSELAIKPINDFTNSSRICSELENIEMAYDGLNESEKNSINITPPQECSEIEISVKDIDAEPISIRFEPYSINLNIEDNPRMCCIKGDCVECCDSSDCARTPTIFVHGHAIAQDTPPDINMDSLNNLQERLEDEGIVNMGRISLYEYFNLPSNVWGQFSNPMSLKVSYYYDVYENEESSIIIPTKNDNLDTYALRIADQIESVLYKTGADKVNIIAHSMGGLVVRRYMQVYGTDDVERVMLSGTPNRGISGWVATLCPLFGERLECRDMREGSLFLNRLNREAIPQDIPFYNVIGVGCDMNGKNGDGIVLKESAKLEGAENIEIEGECDNSETMHTNFIRDLDKYPEYYKTVKDFLEI